MSFFPLIFSFERFAFFAGMALLCFRVTSSVLTSSLTSGLMLVPVDFDRRMPPANTKMFRDNYLQTARLRVA